MKEYHIKCFRFTWYFTHTELHFLQIGFVIAGGGFYSYYIHQGNKSDIERKIVRNKLSFTHTKIFNTFFKTWVQFCVGAIPRLPVILTWIFFILWFNLFYEFLPFQWHFSTLHITTHLQKSSISFEQILLL